MHIENVVLEAHIYAHSYVSFYFDDEINESTLDVTQEL